MITRNTRLYLLFLAFLWLVAVLFRFVFMIWQNAVLSTFSSDIVWKALYIGIHFDGRVMLYASLPLAVFLFTPIIGRFFATSRKLLLWLYTALFLAIFISYVANFAHYSYLTLTVNWAAIDLLGDVRESVEMVWQSYPVIKIFIGTLLFTFVCNRVTKKIFSYWQPAKDRKRDIAMSGLLCFFVIAILIYGQYNIASVGIILFPIACSYVSGKISYPVKKAIFAVLCTGIIAGLLYLQYVISPYPLRWSEAYFAGYNEIAALAQNPFHNIYDTRPSRSKQTYDLEAAKAAYPVIAEFVGLENPDINGMRLDRFAAETSTERPNVVFIIMESMSTHKSSFMFDELETTPFLKSLAARSLYFPNYYASARTTAKATFSTMTGIPDANISYSTSSRDPWVVDQHLIWNAFDGYTKMFMMGGNANWANIRGVLTNNIPNLKLYEENYWKSPRMDVWGISDYNMLQEVNALLEQQDAPFFATILTASFHRPFTVPNNLEGFDYSMPDAEFTNKYGFVDGEYQSMKFCDYAIREFFKVAEQSSYYDNTIFVIIGDHGISESSPSAGENYQKLRLHEYQVPMIIHYPKKLQPQVMTQPGGHVDMFPTIAGLVGIPYQNTTLGRDLLNSESLWTFVLRTSAPPALVSQDRLYIDGTLYSRTANAIAEDWQPMESPDKDMPYLKALSEGMIDFARYLLYNNSKAEAKKAAAVALDRNGE